jgi:hypothetical protein
MFEHKSRPLLPRRKFYNRMARSVGIKKHFAGHK